MKVISLLLVEDIVKRYGQRTVLRKLTFGLEPGERVVLVGPNGSGKSTLLRIIAGLLAPDEGRVVIDGGHWRQERKNPESVPIGYVPERMPFLRFSPEEYLQYMGAIQGIEAGVLAQRINRLLAMCRLENSRRMPIRHFSKGMLHKVGIMQALLSEPKLLLMDEPFSGLDAESQEEVMELLLQLGKQGMGLLFVSHEPEHYGRVATRMIVLNQDGGWQDKLLTSSNTKSNRLLIRAAGLEEAAARELAQKSGAELIMAAREACFVTGESNSDALLQFILGQGGSVKAVYPEREALLKWPGWVHDNAGGVWPPEGEGEQT